MSPQGPESWIWQKAQEMLEDADRLTRQFELRRPHASRPVWQPPVDIFETERQLWILVALPGVEPDRVEIIIEGNILTVAAERTLPRECRAASVHRLEIPHGRFERQIELPAGRFELGQRDLRHGCLVFSLRMVT